MVEEEDKICIEDEDIETTVQCVFDFEDDEDDGTEYKVVRWDTYDQIALERMSYESY